jgi:hypothetical protein
LKHQVSGVQAANFEIGYRSNTKGLPEGVNQSPFAAVHRGADAIDAWRLFNVFPHVGFCRPYKG